MGDGSPLAAMRQGARAVELRVVSGLWKGPDWLASGRWSRCRQQSSPLRGCLRHTDGRRIRCRDAGASASAGDALTTAFEPSRAWDQRRARSAATAGTCGRMRYRHHAATAAFKPNHNATSVHMLLIMMRAPPNHFPDSDPFARIRKLRSFTEGAQIIVMSRRNTPHSWRGVPVDVRTAR
jgi:hypothetical protein